VSKSELISVHDDAGGAGANGRATGWKHAVRATPVSSTHTVVRACEAIADAPSRPAPRAAAAVRRPRWFGGWLNRSRRVLLTLTAVWVVAVFDLGFTLSESGTRMFVELNPFAAHLLGGSASLVIAYKFGLLSLGTVILLWLRKHFIAELGCWFLLAAKVYLALRWLSYFDYLVNGYVDPFLQVTVES
jgi:hypothetical protein